MELRAQNEVSNTPERERRNSSCWLPSAVMLEVWATSVNTMKVKVCREYRLWTQHISEIKDNRMIALKQRPSNIIRSDLNNKWQVIKINRPTAVLRWNSVRTNGRRKYCNGNVVEGFRLWRAREVKAGEKSTCLDEYCQHREDNSQRKLWKKNKEEYSWHYENEENRALRPRTLAIKPRTTLWNWGRNQSDLIILNNMIRDHK